MDLRSKYLKMTAAILLIFGFGAAHATLVTVNMTADNTLSTVAGGLCADSNCTGGTVWSVFGSTSNFNNWQQSNSIDLNLGPGTYYFAWNVFNFPNPSTGNPAALLAEILWDGNANYSSSDWEVFNGSTGAFIENATEYGLNGGNNIWNNVNGGPVSGISGNANWIYTSSNFANADPSAWIRTSITVPEPATLTLFGLGLLGIGFTRRRRQLA